jgi:DNA polymerase-3 subunit alpha
MTWDELKNEAIEKCASYPKEYKKRLDFEFAEIEKQGSENYWVNFRNSDKKFDKNPYGLVFPLLVGITSIDPIKSKIKHVVEYQTDFPDVDIDLLPGTREKIEAFAAQEYGHDKVCSVGLWQTYKPKLALQDAARALGRDPEPIIQLTKTLPDEFDEMSYDDAYKEYIEFASFSLENKEIVDMAYRMVGGIKAQGRHAGGLIIANVPIHNHIPMALRDGHRWTSMWTEGRSPQLSKFGFVKFDMLGLKTLLYIRTCLNLIKKNRDIDIEWTDIDPEIGRAGWLSKDGKRYPISLNDKESLKLANELRTETVFQFETEFAKRILMNGVKTIDDLIVYTSLGRPGPMQMIESYVKRRDGKEDWDDGSVITKRLKRTFGVIVFQEQLADIWRNLASFTVPEAEAARKAVSKKWADKLIPIKGKWIAGASKNIGEKAATEWWDRMETFGRYAFNESHAAAYIIITHRCLFLKAHFPAEWWAAVMSDCDTKRLSKYMGYARSEGVEFGSLDCNKLSLKFDVSGSMVTPGLTSVKNMPNKDAKTLTDAGCQYENIDDFVEKNGKNKTVCERMIKLGAFDQQHPNRKALWTWYQCQYGSDDESKRIKKIVKCAMAWPMDMILKERDRQTTEYHKQYPKRKVIPPKIKKWLPRGPLMKPNIVLSDDFDADVFETAKYIQPTREQVMSLVPNDFTLQELLDFEREYLGYCCHSPMDLFVHDLECTIAEAKESGVLEAYIEKFSLRKGKKSSQEFGELLITDGVENAKVMVWGDELLGNGEEVLQEGKGIRMRVTWKDKFKSFNLKRGCIVIPLDRKDDAVSGN